MTNGNGREWTLRNKVAWWLGFPAAVMATSALVLGLGKWIYSRASVEYVDQRVETREPRDNARAVEARIEKQVEKQDVVLNNVRDNLLLLMDRSRVEPKPMPPIGGQP